MISRFDNVGEAETMESKYFLARYRNPVALDKQGRNSWGTTAALLHAWQQAKWPFLPDDVAFSMHGYLSQCTSCFFGTAQPATLLRGARVFRTDCQAQCVGCVPHTWCEEKQRATRSHTYKPAPNCTRAHTFRDMWNEVPLEDVESSLQNTFRLVLFPVTDLSIVDTVMSVAPIREVTVRQGAVLYDLSRWLTPRITRLSLHSAPCVTDQVLLLLCGHLKHVTSLHLVSVPVSDASLNLLAPEFDQLKELVIANTNVQLPFIHAARFPFYNVLESLHFQIQDARTPRKERDTFSKLERLLEKYPHLIEFSAVVPDPSILPHLESLKLCRSHWKRFCVIIVEMDDFNGFRLNGRWSTAIQPVSHQFSTRQRYFSGSVRPRPLQDVRFLSLRRIDFLHTSRCYSDSGSDLSDDSYDCEPRGDYRGPRWRRFNHFDDNEEEEEEEDDEWMEEGEEYEAYDEQGALDMMQRANLMLQQIRQRLRRR